MMTLDERMALLRDFNEGCEMEDLVSNLVHCAQQLDLNDAELIVLIAEDVVRDSIENSNDWEDYDRMCSPALHQHLFLTPKLSKIEYMKQYDPSWVEPPKEEKPYVVFNDLGNPVFYENYILASNNNRVVYKRMDNDR